MNIDQYYQENYILAQATRMNQATFTNANIDIFIKLLKTKMLLIYLTICMQLFTWESF